MGFKSLGGSFSDLEEGYLNWSGLYILSLPTHGTAVF